MEVGRRGALTAVEEYGMTVQSLYRESAHDREEVNFYAVSDMEDAVLSWDGLAPVEGVGECHLCVEACGEGGYATWSLAMLPCSPLPPSAPT